MSSGRPLAAIAGKILANEARGAAKPEDEVRARAVAAIARTMRERKQRQAWWRRGAFALAVAAGAALVVGFGWSSRHGGPAATASSSSPAVSSPAPAAAASFVRGVPAVVRRGARLPLAEGAPLEPGDRLVVDLGSRTTVSLPGGSYLVLEERAEVLLVAGAPAMTFELVSGSLRADVAKLGPSQRFVVRTADAEVEVHGTSFDVLRVPADPACGDGNTTRVKVHEGVVAVRARGAETFVRANDSWPAACSPVAPEATQATTARKPSAAVTPSGRSLTAPNDGPASDLATQNDSFESAVARKRQGDVPGAIAGFEEFLARYPGSHLAQSARAERMKLLRGVNHDRARLAARDYLDRYPSGFAHTDAELILSE